MPLCPKCQTDIHTVRTRQERMMEGECFLDSSGRIDCHVERDYAEDVEYYCNICKETICRTEDDAERFLKGEEII